MIRPEDAQFHPPTTDDPLWAETNYFGLYAGQDPSPGQGGDEGDDPARPLNIGVYALFREPLGVVGSTVSVNSRRVTHPWAADYWDAWQHLAVPQPPNLLDYALANGLRVRCPEPNKVWDVDYSDPAAGLELHFRLTALMEPYDINDPAMDPMAAGRDGADVDRDKTWGHAYAGHFDLTGHYEGEIVLRGRRTPIDCVSTMDHSWGIRAERQTSRLSWQHAHFSPDLAIHVICDFGTDAGPDAPSTQTMTHGYVLDHGTVYGLKAGGGTTERRGFYPERIHLSLTDSADRTWQLDGEALTTFPWLAWPGTVGHNALLRWTVAEAQTQSQVGYGECMDFVGLGELGAVHHRLTEAAQG